MAARVFEAQQRVLNSSSSHLYPQRRIEMVEPGKLRPVRSNARRHSRKQIRQIAASIDRFGFQRPNNKIVNVPGARRRQVPARVIGNELAEVVFGNPYKVQIVGQAWARRNDGVNDVTWQGAPKLIGVGAVVYDQQKTLGVWVQNITRQGAVYELMSFYRAGDY
jgi:hypothetical protein